MHIILGIPIIIGTIYILTMTKFGRWLTFSCFLLVAIGVGTLFATGTLQWIEPGNDYRVASNQAVKPGTVDHTCDFMLADLGKDKDPMIDQGIRLFVGKVCPTRPEGIR